MLRQTEPSPEWTIRSLFPPVLASGFYLVIFVALLVGILAANDAHFTYSLDDPYIHLALSEQIAKGHYGINAVEAASPSSSALWPVLLAAFARFRWHVYTPLALNVLAGVASAFLMGVAVARWPRQGNRFADGAWKAVSAVLLVLVANLGGLTFLGMEHTLQVMLSICCALGILACMRGRPIPVLCLVAAAVGPLVRYENVGLSVALAIALWGQRKGKQAGALLVASVVPLLLFSAFLHHIGLPPLPTSVLVKAGAVASDRAIPGAVHKVYGPIGQSAFVHSKMVGRITFLMRRVDYYTSENRDIVLVLFATLVGLAVTEKERVRRFALGGAALSTGLHLMVGRYGWFYRYEVYIVIFAVLVVLEALNQRPRFLLGWYALGLLACASAYITALRQTVLSAHEVYMQQFQMHRFATDFAQGNVAVNDLGLVSYDRRPDEYVLDLAGLASLEAARQKDKSAAWLDSVTKRHDISLVMLYHTWYPDLPADWVHLGQICQERDPVILGGRCVDFYAAKPSEADDLQDEFNHFAARLPLGDQVTLEHHPE